MRILKKISLRPLKECQPRQYPEKVILNYSNISLSDVDKSLLVKGLQFPKKLLIIQ